MLAMCSECQCESQRRLYVAWKWLMVILLTVLLIQGEGACV